MPMTPARNSFASGELSPSLYGRTDMAKYQSGCRTLTNMIVHPHGGASNRTGTQYIGAALGQGRLIPFQFNVEQAYVLEFTAGKMRVLKNGGIVLNGVDVVNSTLYRWVAVGTSYRLQTIGFGNPGLSEPTSVLANGVALTRHDGTYDTMPVGTWDYETYAPDGFNTLWVRLAGDVSPNLQNFGYLVALYSGMLEVTSPYAFADLAALRYCQSADTIFLAHPSYPPYKLTRRSHYSWTFAAISFSPHTVAPIGLAGTYTADPGDTTKPIKYQVSTIGADGEESLPSGEISVTIDSPWASGALVNLSWTAVAGAEGYNLYKNTRGFWGLLGGVLRNTGKLDAATAIGSATDTGYEPAKAFDTLATTYWQDATKAIPFKYIGMDYGSGVTKTVGKVRIKQHSALYATTSVRLYHSADGTIWTGLQTFALGANDSYQDLIVTATQVAKRYWKLRAEVAPAGGAWLVSQVEFYEYAVPVTFSDDNILEDAGNGPQDSSNPFQAADSYPGAVGLFQQRLFLARTNARPTTIWATKTGQFENMGSASPSKDDDSLSVTIASRQVDEVRHLVPMRELMLLTAGSEWRVDAGSQSDAITPTAIRFALQGYNGCSDVPPLVVGNSLLYVQRNGRAVRDMYYQLNDDGYVGNDLTILANHLLEDYDLSDWTWAQHPDHVVWSVRADGKLLGFTYLKEHDVWAWHKHETDTTDTYAAFESVCSIPTSGDDEVYFIVKRRVNGVTVRYLEKLAPRLASSLYMNFLDCAVIGSTTGTGRTYTGLTHLAGKAVTAVCLTDGAVETATVTAGGVITLSKNASWIMGLAYTSTLETLNLEIDSDGSVQGRRKTQHRVLLRFRNTRAAKVGYDASHLDAVTVLTATQLTTLSTLFSDDVRVQMPASWNQHGRIMVTSNGPQPFTILEIVPEVSIGE